MTRFTWVAWVWVWSSAALYAAAEEKPQLDCRAYLGSVEAAAVGQRELAIGQLRLLEEPFLNEKILTDRGAYRTQALGCIGRAPVRTKRAAALLHLENSISYRHEHHAVRSALNQLLADDLLRGLGRSGGSTAGFAVEGYLALAYSLQGSAEPATAVDYFEQALRLKPQLAEAQLGIGTAYEKLGKYQAAQESLAAAVAINPRLAEAELRLAMCLERMGDTKGARAALERTIELTAPRSAAASSATEVAAKQPARPGETLPAPPFVRQIALAELGMLELQRAQFQQAVALLERALAADPQEQSTYIALAYAHERCGASDKSVELARRALRAGDNRRDSFRYLYDLCQVQRGAELMDHLWSGLRAEAQSEATQKLGGAP